MLIGTDKYPGNVWDLLNNVTGWNTSYNGEIWFLFPYCLLALSSKLIYKIMDKTKSLFYLTASFIICMFCQYCVSRYGASYLYSHHLAHMPFIYFTLLFSFILGASIAKFGVVERCKNVMGGGEYKLDIANSPGFCKMSV